MAAGYNCSAINTDLNTDINPDEWAAYQSNDALLAQANENPFLPFIVLVNPTPVYLS